MIDPVELRERVARVESTVASFASMSRDARVATLAAAVGVLADAEMEIGRELRNELERESGLTSQGVAWALDTTLSAMTESAFREVLDRAEAATPGGGITPRGLVVVVLSANVSTAPFFALAMPLLFGNAVVAKASHRDDVGARAFLRALASVDATFAESLDVVTFEGGDAAREEALLARANALVVYGGDATVAELARRAPRTTTVVPHGHGLGIGVLPRSVASDVAARASALERFALDVAAYDQRGCLSPHALVVEGDASLARSVARELADRPLARYAKSLPRGPLPSAMSAPQLAWRSAAVTRGELFEGDGFATSAEPDSAIRPSPGYRNVQVVACDDARAIAARVAPLGAHLKVVGVPDEADFGAIRASLPWSVAPRLVTMGRMQTPAFGTTWDGELPQTGLVRYVGGR